MRIVFLLQVSRSVAMGGSELQTEFIMNEALNSGHDAVMISDGGNGIAASGDGRHLLLKPRSRLYAFRNIPSLITLLKRLDPDIIYQRWRIPYTGVAAWHCRRRRARMVFNAAGRSDVLKNRVPLNVFFPFRLFNERLGRYGIRHADQLVAQTKEQARFFQSRFGRESIVIPNGHPVPEPPFSKSSPPEVIWVSNIKPVKRLELFLDLAHELRDVDVRFLCIGRSPQSAYERIIEKKIRTASNVEFTGELPLDETCEKIARASLLINTSRFEGFPNTFIQAWMRETPVISMSVDPDDILMKNGIGIHSGGFERMTRDVRDLLADSERRMKMGRRAREYAVARHDIRDIGRRYLELFSRLMGETPVS